MAFITSRNPLSGREIKISVYGPEGKPQEVSLIAQYKRKKRKEIQALQEKFAQVGKPVLDDANQPTGEVHGTPYETDLDMLRDVLGGWVGPQNEDGSERVYSHESLEDLVEEWPELVQPLVSAFFDVHREIPRAKN